jgi:ATP synthase protein I
MSEFDDLKSKIELIKKKYKKDKVIKKNISIGSAFKMSTELVAAVFVATFIGWYIDKWLGTKPIFLIILLFVGIVAGMFNVVRSAKMINKD